MNRKKQLRKRRRAIRTVILLAVFAAVILAILLAIYLGKRVEQADEVRIAKMELVKEVQIVEAESVKEEQSATQQTADATQSPAAETEPPSAEPVTLAPTLLDFLQIALKPVGQTMYVWGGGWNEEDTGAGIEAVTLGVSSRWVEFAAKQDASYDHRAFRYQIHDGLDCSGYVGWAVYNVLEKKNDQNGYVVKSIQMAEYFADRGLGEYIPAEKMTDWQPGDIMSMQGHVWISLGMCSDGSVLLLHASPPGVIFSGTELEDGGNSQAIKLAQQIMSIHYPEWYAKYPDCARSHSYLTGSGAMRWSRQILRDEEGVSAMSAEEIVALLFS